MGLLSRGAWSYGRAWSRAINKHGRSSKDYTQTADFLNNIINKRINTTRGMSGIELETEVLREIKRLKSEGKDGDIDAIREVVQNRFKTYHRLGPKLELEIIRISQIKALAGEEVNYAQIEREILDASEILGASKTNFSWMIFMLWIVFPFIMFPRQIFKNISHNKEIDKKFSQEIATEVSQDVVTKKTNKLFRA